MFTEPVVNAPPIEIEPVVRVVFQRAAATEAPDTFIVSIVGVVNVGDVPNEVRDEAVTPEGRVPENAGTPEPFVTRTWLFAVVISPIVFAADEYKI